MKRVMIIDSPGTGKSTFAKKLAVKTGFPLIHLDFYYHDKTKNYLTDKEAWKAQVDEFTARPTWIIDGNYGRTMAERMQRADTIFYFNMPRRTALWGVIKRRANAHRTVRTDMPQGWKERAGWKFLKYVWTFRGNYAAATQQMLVANSGKQIVVFKNHRQIAHYLKVL